jgi:hypothetical protein
VVGLALKAFIELSTKRRGISICDGRTGSTPGRAGEHAQSITFVWRLRNIQTVYEALAAIGGFRFLFAPTAEGLTRFLGNPG